MGRGAKQQTPRGAKSVPAPGRPSARWAMLMPNLPGKATTQRVRIWRRLQAIGAVAVRPSVYVLPARDEHIETFQWVAKEISALGGQTSLCEGQFLDGVTDDEIERKFHEARTSDYAALGEDARALATTLKAKRLSAEKLAACETQLARLRRRLEEVVAIVFFDAPGRGAIEGLLGALESATRSHRGPRPRPDRLEPTARPRAATWVTRAGVHVDRIACVWLIRRFIDPDAKLVLVSPRGYAPREGELRFDMFEAEFTHVGDRCSFEVLVERMRLEDPALAAIAEIVHDLDIRDAKFARPETAGVHAQITGICAAHRDDLARIAAATPMFEALYAFFSLHSKSPARGPRS